MDDELLRIKLNEFWTKKRVKKYEEKMMWLLQKIGNLDQEYFMEHNSHLIRFTEYRLKTPESIYGKMIRKNKPKDIMKVEECINDLAGIRIICYDVEQVYWLVRKIRDNDEFEVLKVKNYIRNPKDNGYQSYHILIKADDIKIEIQLRTVLMDLWSSLDTILLYKKNKNINDEIKSNIHKFAKNSRRMDRMIRKMLENVKEGP